MSTYATHHHNESESTHAFPAEFEAKMTEAKQWYDARTLLEEAIARGGGIAERNQEDWDASDRVGATILDEIVEIVEETWGFGGDLRPGR